MLYFDHNATAPLCAAARDAWLDAVDRFIGNPSSPHRLGSRADAAIGSAREKLAGFLGCEPEKIVWTSGATESNNTVVQHFAAARTGEAWVSAIEHPSVLEATRRWFEKQCRFIPVHRNGTVDLDWLQMNLTKGRPAFIAVMAANNETGVLQPWREVHALCSQRGIPFFCDAAQWIGKLPAQGLGKCDFVSGCAHKFGGPQGVGFLKAPDRINPLLHGGPQEERRRAGTENVAGILAMLAALEDREAALSACSHAEREEWRAAFTGQLQHRLDDVEIVGGDIQRLWNTVSAVMPETPLGQRWVVKLDKMGAAVSTGSACASGQEKPSHVLAAMNYAVETTGRVLRFSSGWETSRGDWEKLLRLIEHVASDLQIVNT